MRPPEITEQLGLRLYVAKIGDDAPGFVPLRLSRCQIALEVVAISHCPGGTGQGSAVSVRQGNCGGILEAVHAGREITPHVRFVGEADQGHAFVLRPTQPRGKVPCLPEQVTRSVAVSLLFGQATGGDKATAA